MVYDWLTIVQGRLLPATCLLCGAPGEADLDLCPGCRAALPAIGPACRCCGAALEAQGPLCGACLRRPPPFEATLAPYRYASPVDHLIWQLKFRGRLAPARTLGRLLADAGRDREGPLPECLVPVPLHRRRLGERGYNQALELARPVARELGVPLAPRLARRTHATPPQAERSGRERRRNVRGAFTVPQPPAARHVAIVDDVVTSGATVAELARALRRAGVERVEVWAVARA